VPRRPFKDQLAGHRRASLCIFHIAVILSLIFSLAIGFLQIVGFHSVSVLAILALMVILWSFGLFLYSWRFR
jgi:hypothetical protein